MGFKLRKSIKLGSNFRINISKSGIGYSWGFPGYRRTISAKGKGRSTFSVQGSGLSYSISDPKLLHKSNKSNRKNTSSAKNSKLSVSPHPSYSQDNGLEEAKQIESADIKNFQEAEFSEYISYIKKIILIYQLLLIALIVGFFVTLMLIYLIFIPLLSIIGIIILQVKCKNTLIYEMDDYSKNVYQNRHNSIMSLNKCQCIWQIIEESQVVNKKTHSGAGRSIKRKPIRITTNIPFYLRSNYPVSNITLAKERLYFLPDRILIMKNNDFGVLKYSDVRVDVRKTVFIEEEAVPKDTTIIGQTWKYVNKNGEPDKRFSNNRQIPRCQYGKILLSSSSGLNIELQGSNYSVIKQFHL